MQDIVRQAALFRTAIIDSRGGGYIAFRDFPRGSCSDASILLGEYFREQGLGEWTYTSGLRQTDNYSHAWIEQNGLIVDITADQFDGRQPVFVTRDRTWHAQFEVDTTASCPATIGIWDAHTRDTLTKAYLAVKTRLGH